MHPNSSALVAQQPSTLLQPPQLHHTGRRKRLKVYYLSLIWSLGSWLPPLLIRTNRLQCGCPCHLGMMQGELVAWNSYHQQQSGTFKAKWYSQTGVTGLTGSNLGIRPVKSIWCLWWGSESTPPGTAWVSLQVVRGAGPASSPGSSPQTPVLGLQTNLGTTTIVAAASIQQHLLCAGKYTRCFTHITSNLYNHIKPPGLLLRKPRHEEGKWFAQDHIACVGARFKPKAVRLQSPNSFPWHHTAPSYRSLCISKSTERV